MKFAAMLAMDAFMISLGLSMLVGQTFTGQGYVVGALGVAGGVLHFVSERQRWRRQPKSAAYSCPKCGNLFPSIVPEVCPRCGQDI